MSKKFAAISIYRCYQNNTITKSIDIKAQYFECDSEEDVKLAILAEGDHEYLGSKGHVCCWKLQEIMAVDEIYTLEHGDELTGFITDDTTLVRDAWEDNDSDLS